jgi:hypothetical protein
MCRKSVGCFGLRRCQRFGQREATPNLELSGLVASGGQEATIKDARRGPSPNAFYQAAAVTGPVPQLPTHEIRRCLTLCL